MYIKVIVHAGTKKEELIKLGDDHFEIFVKEKAEQNLANLAVIRRIAEFFKVPSGKIRIISGHHHPRKILSIGD